jgi:predicted  nucleic acid-binding Zn-ribbon protein
MSLQDLLAYQDADVRIKKIERSIATSEEKKTVDMIKINFDEAKKKMLSAEAYADKIVSAYNDAVASLDKINAESEKLIEKLGSAENKDDIIKQLESIKNMVSEMVKKVENLKIQSEKAIKTYASAQNEGKKLKEDYVTASEKYKSKLEKAEAEKKELKKKVEELKCKVSEEYLTQYDTLVSQNIIPPFVKAQGEDKSFMCGGCFMALSKQNSEQLIKNGTCHCDACKRIIYKG